MRSSTDGLIGRRSILLPFVLAAQGPALTRSQIMPRSNSAKTPQI
jgi:hypothetical protein